MVGVLIRMRLRLLARSLGSGPQVLGLLAGLMMLAFAALLTVAVIAGAERGLAVAPLLFTVWTLGWLVGPVLTSSSDDTLRPEHFRLLPVRAQRLASGLLLAGAVGIAPLMTLFGFAGLVLVAAGIGVGAVVLAVLGVVLQLALVLTASKVVVGLLGATLRSRRGKDVGALLVTLVLALVAPLQVLLRDSMPALIDGAGTFGITTVVRWFPSSWAATAVQLAARGQWPWSCALLVGLAVLVGLLVLTWSVLLRDHLMTDSPTASSARSATGGERRSRLRLTTPTGVVAVKELRLWWRDVRRRSAVLASVVAGIAMPVAAGYGSDSSILPFLGLVVPWLCTINLGNLYGYDGPAFRQVLVSPGVEVADVRGRQLGWLVLVAPIALLGAILGPAISGAVSTYPWVLSLTPAFLGAGSGLVVLLSMLAPFPMPEQNGNPFAGGKQAGCGKGVLSLVLSLVHVVAALPSLLVLILGTVFDLVWLPWLAISLGLVGGILCFWGLGRVAVTRLRARGPEILGSVLT